MKNFALIPARGGSKGIPRKNVKLLKGIPLIAHSIIQAKESKSVNRVIVSTDDEEIAEVALKFGAEVPFLRPAELATSEAKSIDVVIHACNYVNAHENLFDTLILLQPTSPYRPAGCIDEALDLYKSTNTNSLISVRTVPDHYNPHWVFEKDKDERLKMAIPGSLISRRQDLPKSYHRDGAIYIVDINYLHKSRQFISETTVGFEIDSPALINIDSEEDWEVAKKHL